MPKCTSYEVNPALGTNSGTGTHADPFGNLQYAVDTIVRDSVNGDCVSVWDTGVNTLALDVHLAGYGAPTPTAPLSIVGMTSTGVPGDGGVGVIDGAGLYGLFTGIGPQYVLLKNMHVRNWGTANYGVRLGHYSMVLDCEVHDGGGLSAIYLEGVSEASHVYVHDCSGIGVHLGSAGCRVRYSRLADGVKKFSGMAIKSGNTHGVIEHNVISVSGTTHGMTMRNGTMARRNSLYSAGGSGSAMTGDLMIGQCWGAVTNNLVEGFSGVGGWMINNNPTGAILFCDKNKYYNMAGAIASPERILSGNTENTALNRSPFRNAAAEDFRVVGVAGTAIAAGIKEAAALGKIGIT